MQIRHEIMILNGSVVSTIPYNSQVNIKQAVIKTKNGWRSMYVIFV